MSLGHNLICSRTLTLHFYVNMKEYNYENYIEIFDRIVSEIHIRADDITIML